MEFWSDMGYMIPPFLACKPRAWRSILNAGMGLTGVSSNTATGSQDLLGAALTQWLGESQQLLNTADHLFYHVKPWAESYWSTGNGWMLMGGLRTVSPAAPPVVDAS